MLLGREAERAQLERLLAAVKQGQGRALVLRGEAGVGKTTLLEHAVKAGTGFRVLHALGVESEAVLPFAALHELVYPVVDLLDELPAPQSRAMKAALALEHVEDPDRFSVYAATLGLLAAAAAHERARSCRIVRSPGLAELRLGGLSDDEAKSLLVARAPSLLPAVVERIVHAAGGNPLALFEFAPAAADGDDAGRPLPVGESVERAFLARSSRLSPTRKSPRASSSVPGQSSSISAAHIASSTCGRAAS